MEKPFNLIIAGGKTGGHLFPGIAVAQAITELNPGTGVLFVGTDAPFEVQTLKTYGYAHKIIFSKPFKGKHLFHKLSSMGIVLVSVTQAMMLMKTLKPDFVLGIGGYSSFGVVLAAKIMGIPTAIQEQNAFPGLTNRWLFKFADTVFTSFEETKGWAHHPKVNYVGNPIRKTTGAGIEDNLSPKGCDQGKITLLITGGSQGAKSINTAFMDALALMDDTGQFNIIHQTGRHDESLIQKKYADMNINARVKAFFHDMPRLQATADLAVTRAGAGIISELCAHGLPAILIPFPHAADDHQAHNARSLEAKGAAVMIRDGELTGKTLKQRIDTLIKDKTRLQEMSEKLKLLAKPDAARIIADFILNTKDMEA